MRVMPLFLLTLLAPSLALAHPLHDSGTLMAGALHPVGGLDHTLAMLAVGFLAAQRGGRALWALPGVFVGAMLLGGAAGSAGLGSPAVEPMILASILLLGVTVALAVRLPLLPVLVAIALFGAAHGWAHGAEGPQSGIALYALGFALATMALHGVGIGLGRALGGAPLRLMGGATALAGFALAVA